MDETQIQEEIHNEEIQTCMHQPFLYHITYAFPRILCRKGCGDG